MEYIFTLFLALLILSLIGVFRNQFTDTSPKSLINLSDTTQKWITDKSWFSRLTPLFSVFIIVYNFIIWALYGITTILDGLLYIFKIAISIFKWIWNEILHPTVFLVVKLIWHYFVIFIWKFFSASVNTNNFTILSKRKNIIFSFKMLLQIFSISAFFFLISTYYNFSFISVAIISLIIIVLIQYQIFRSTNFYTETNSSTLRKMKIVGTSILSTLIFLGLIFIFKNYSDKIIIQGLGVSIAQISTPIILISLITFLGSTFFLSPYVIKSNDSSFELFDFLKQFLLRLPKYIYSLPFHILGLIIATIIPAIIVFVLSFGINFTTNKSIPDWSSDIIKLSSSRGEIKLNDEKISTLNNEIFLVDSIYNKDTIEIQNKIQNVNANLYDAHELKDLLQPNKILSFEGDPYVGESQKFSFLEVLSAGSYTWEVIKSSNDSTIKKSSNFYQKKSRNDGIINTYVFEYTWQKPGSYRIEVSPKNSCETGSSAVLSINVLDKPKQKLKFSSPRGKSLICPGDTVVFVADQSKWVESWHWELPNGCQYISEDTESKIEVVWGNNPGTIRVYGVGAKGESQISVTKGLLVNLIPKLGYPEIEIDMIPDEELTSFKFPVRQNLYYTMVDAEFEINELNNELNKLEYQKIILESNYNDSIQDLTSKIINLDDKNSGIRIFVFGIILALIGFVFLLSLLFTNLWTYFVRYNYFIYDFEQEGIHYINSQISFYRNKNKNQPLFAWFILGVSFLFFIGLTSLV